MNDVSENQIASRRHLDFDANANPNAIDDAALDPIHIAGRRVRPITDIAKRTINQFTQHGGAVTVNFFL